MGPAQATLVCVHPLPTHGGMMDSHVLRKASWRLPALADVAVVRFNTRGTSSPAGTSEGHFDNGAAEGLDLAAALAWVTRAGLPDPWVLGWSFGSDVVIRHANVDPVIGGILLSPPLHYSDPADLVGWTASGRPIVALVPEFDDYLRPDEARRRFAGVRQLEVVTGPGAKHLWVGEPNVQFVLNSVVGRLRPGFGPLPTTWDGTITAWNDLP